MKGFPSFCIALSAAALLTGSFGGARAQSQEGRSGSEPAGVAAGFDHLSMHLFRGKGKINLRRQISVTITPQGEGGPGEPITFSDMRVRIDGSYEQELAGGHRIEGQVSGFGSAAFSTPRPAGESEKRYSISGVYHGPNGLRANYETEQAAGQGGWLSTLRRMMYFQAHHYSEDPMLKLAQRDFYFATSDASEHIERGKSLSGRDAEDLSVDLRLYVDDVGFVGQSPDCTGLRCTADDVIEQFDVDFVFSPGTFVPHNADDVDTVLSHEGIHLVLDRSEFNNIYSSLSFGAWMDDAGFFVATGGTMGWGDNKRSARMAAAAGELTGSRPAGDAVWRGSMVGSVLEGEHKDHLLRGDAQLEFNMERSNLKAAFFNIKDYDRFGERHKDAQGRNINALTFGRIPVAADGSYARSYDGLENRGGSIRGAFYGDGHGETAGTFERSGIVGAFGAKKVVTN